MQFLCDEMLKGLAKWLRAAGYDAALVDDAVTDREVLHRALLENRRLLTRDRKLCARRGAGEAVILLHGNSIDAWVCELNLTQGLDWQLAPFSRCVKCNVPLKTAAAEWRATLLDDTREMLEKKELSLYQCTACGRLYWEGSHVRRMHATLKRFDGMCREGGAGRSTEAASSPLS